MSPGPTSHLPAPRPGGPASPGQRREREGEAGLACIIRISSPEAWARSLGTDHLPVRVTRQSPRRFREAYPAGRVGSRDSNRDTCARLVAALVIGSHRCLGRHTTQLRWLSPPHCLGLAAVLSRPESVLVHWRGLWGRT